MLLHDADERCRMICMRTTLNLDDTLLDAALEATGESEKTKVIHLGLQALVRQKAAERLAKLGGTAPRAKAAPRKRQWQHRNG
jgi:Arc/MetJ family transcription regulator